MKKESQSVVEDVANRIWPAPLSTTHIELATKIAERCVGVKHLDLAHQYADPRKFTVGEFCPRFALGNGGPNTLEGKTVAIMMLPGPYNSVEGLMERACITATAAKDHLADKVVLLMSDMPHARQDRGVDEDKVALGEPNTVRWHARKLAVAGIDEIITTHEHTPRIAAFFAIEYGLVPRELMSEDAPDNPRDIKVPQHVDVNDERVQQIGRQVFKNISPHAILADYILHHSSLVGTDYLKHGGARLAVKAMDAGNRIFINEVASALFLPNIARIYCGKARKEKNDPEKVQVRIIEVSDNLESLDGMVELYADDGLDTGGTMMKAVAWSNEGNVCSETGKKYGIPEDRLVYFTHAWLGGDAHMGVQAALLKGLPTREFVTTNSRPYISDGQNHMFKRQSTILRLAGLWSDALVANELGHDVMSRYVGFESEEQQHEFLKRMYVLKRHSSHFLSDDEVARRKVSFYLRE